MAQEDPHPRLRSKEETSKNTPASTRRDSTKTGVESGFSLKTLFFQSGIHCDVEKVDAEIAKNDQKEGDEPITLDDRIIMAQYAVQRVFPNPWPRKNVFDDHSAAYQAGKRHGDHRNDGKKNVLKRTRHHEALFHTSRHGRKTIRSSKQIGRAHV